MRASSVVLVPAAIAAERAAALSSGCTTQLGVLALSDLSCLSLTSALPLLNGGSNSIISGVNTYLQSVCTSSNTCSNSTLNSAVSTIQSSCSSDISGGGDAAAEVQTLVTALQHYPQLYAAACSKNTTNYCVYDSLVTVQTDIGQNLTTDFITSALSGTGDARSQLQQVFATGNLCTGCASTIYYEALQANSSLSSTSFGQSISSQCGASFGTSASAAGVSTAAVSANTASASSSTSSTARSSASRLVGTGGVVSGVVALLGLGLGVRLVL